jgi:asparagine synthase (glutamine-hydrolysing)
MKIRDGVGKWPLRQILYRHVPQYLIDRPKIGFGIPLGDWLRGPLREWAEDLLFDGELLRSSLLDPKRLNTIWSQHLNGSRQNEHQLWSILMLHSWLRDTHA